MLTIERQQAILSLIKEKGAVTVRALSEQFFIGEATIRRDLEKLEKAGVLKRTYGGAVIQQGLDTELPLIVRETEMVVEKSGIAESAAELVSNGDTIIMDSSSTVKFMSEYLQNKSDLTIITNGAKTAANLAEKVNCKLYCTGGRMRINTMTYYGESANAFMERFNADYAFISCGALSMNKGVADSNEEEARLRQLMIKAARTTVLLCDFSKFDAVSFCIICDWDSLDYIITDNIPSSDWQKFAEQKNVRLICHVIDS